MNINLTVGQEAELSHIAALEGKGADEFAREVFLRGLNAEATLIAKRVRNHNGEDAVARILELRQGNMLPEGHSRHTDSALLKGTGEDVKVVQEFMRRAIFQMTMNV